MVMPGPVFGFGSGVPFIVSLVILGVVGLAVMADGGSAFLGDLSAFHAEAWQLALGPAAITGLQYLLDSGINLSRVNQT